MLMDTPGIMEEAKEEDVGEAEEAEETGENKESGKAVKRTSSRSPASTVEERDTKPLIAPAPRNPRTTNARSRKVVVQDEPGNLPMQQKSTMRKHGSP